MRFNRRQLLACCLALGVIGLVATADPPVKNAAPAKPPAPAPTHWVVVADPVPSLPVLPVCTPVPVPVMLPTAEPPLAPVVSAMPVVTLPVMIDAPKVEAPKLDLPKVEVAKLPPKVELPEIKPVTPTMPDIKPVTPTLPVMPKVESEAPPLLPSASSDTPKVTLAKAVTPAAFQRITIDYSSKPLRFEVQAGEVTLKVECDAIDVRMPGEQGVTATPLKATGNVKFTAPGFRGVCDEIVLYTSTGEAVLHGGVKLQCRQGNVETEVTGTNVKFKLGAAVVGVPVQPNR